MSVFVLLGLTMGGAQAADPDSQNETAVESLITRLQAFTTIQAEFEQHSSRGYAQFNGTPQKGRFWLAKPNQFRVESGPPLSQTIVSDGKSLWTYDRDLEQVIISHFDGTATDIPVLLLAGNEQDIKQSFLVTLVDTGAQTLYVLTPREENAMVSSIAIAFEAGEPRRISIENAMREQTIIDLVVVNLDVELEPDIFVFETPEAVDVIDDRPH